MAGPRYVYIAVKAPTRATLMNVVASKRRYAAPYWPTTASVASAARMSTSARASTSPKTSCPVKVRLRLRISLRTSSGATIAGQRRRRRNSWSDSSSRTSAPSEYAIATSTTPKPGEKQRHAEGRREDALSDDRRCDQLAALERVEHVLHRPGHRVEEQSDREDRDRQLRVAPVVERVDQRDRGDRHRDPAVELQPDRVPEVAVQTRSVFGHLAQQVLVDAQADRRHRDLAPGEREHEDPQSLVAQLAGHDSQQNERAELADDLAGRADGGVLRRSLAGLVGCAALPAGCRRVGSAWFRSHGGRCTLARGWRSQRQCSTASPRSRRPSPTGISSPSTRVCRIARRPGF